MLWKTFLHYQHAISYYNTHWLNVCASKLGSKYCLYYFRPQSKELLMYISLIPVIRENKQYTFVGLKDVIFGCFSFSITFWTTSSFKVYGQYFIHNILMNWNRRICWTLVEIKKCWGDQCTLRIHQLCSYISVTGCNNIGKLTFLSNHKYIQHFHHHFQPNAKRFTELLEAQ
jgi:hypothetical protein